jgi:eukaryotic-like serine/threonine-protein kinase
MTTVSRTQRVRALFGEALRVSEAERGAFLDRACEGDAELRREVAELLELDGAASTSTDTVLGDASGAQWLAAELHGDHADEPEPMPRTIGPYSVERELGRGGMGVVYEASQREPSRRVAIKIMNTQVLGPSSARRFRREMQALAQLRHPGIVQVLDAGADASRLYMVMELVRGSSLRSFLRDHSPTVAERLVLVAMICDAVAHAHQRGVIHRDLTPDNIMVQSIDPGAAGSGSMPGIGVQPKILDFGVCRLLESDAPTTTHTYAGQVVGTIPYLSPEQAQGQTLATDTRSDVYALGVIAFEVLTGRRPFEVDRMPIAAALHVVLTRPPTPLGSLDRALRGDIETMIHKAMAREPRDRYQSASDFAVDLRRFLNTEPILARPPTLRYVAGRFIRRNRALSTAVGASLAVLIASLIIVSRFWSEAHTTREASLWQTYVASMNAAALSIAEGDVAGARRQLDAATVKHRGWEHRHFASRLDQSRRAITPVLPQGMSAPFSLAPGVTPGEMILVSASASALLDLSKGDAATPLHGPEMSVWLGAQAARFPDFVPLSDGGVTVIDPATHQPRTFKPSNWPYVPASVSRARLSADGTLMAFYLVESASPMGASVCLLDCASGALTIIYPAQERRPQGLALTSDGARVAFGLGDRDVPRATVRIVDTASPEHFVETAVLPDRPVNIAFDPAGQRMYVQCIDGTLDSWDIRGPEPALARRMKGPYDASLSLSVSPDGAMLAAGSRDRYLRIFDARTLDVRHELLGHNAEVQDARFSPDIASLWSVDTNGAMQEWDLRPPPAGPAASPMVLRGHTNLVHPIAISETRRQAVLGSWDRSISVHSLETGAKVAGVTVDSLVIDLALSPDESLIVSREFEHLVRVWDARTLAPVASFPHQTHRLDQAHFDSTGRRFVLDLYPEDDTILVAHIDTASVTREPLSALSQFEGPTIDHATGVFMHVVQLPPQFRLVVQSYRDGQVRFTTPARRTAVEAFSFSPDRARFAVQGIDDKIRIFDTRTFALQRTLVGHTREVLDTVFSPDGTRLFSADLTGVIRVWDIDRASEVAQLRGHTAHIRRLAISRDGTTLISGSRDGTARVWVAP